MTPSHRGSPVAPRLAARLAAAGREAATILVRHGPAALASALLDGRGLRSADAEYAGWVERFGRLTDADRAAIRAHQETLGYRPRISVVMPVHDPPRRFLCRSIASVRRQLYPDWELCLADDASQAPEVRELLTASAREDERIRLVRRPERGHICAATNSALELVSGEFVAFLDHDDELAEHALYLVAQELNRSPDADLIYSDHDKMDAAGRRFRPYFKPGWSPELFLAQNYVTHLAVYRTSLVRTVGGMRQGLEGGQDYDLTLRCLERSRAGRVRHLPWVLYHWRALPSSTASGLDAKPYAVEACRSALRQHLRRQSVAAEVVPAPLPQFHRIVHAAPQPPPEVSLILRPGGAKTSVARSLARLLRRTDHPKLEIVTPDLAPADLRRAALERQLSAERQLLRLEADSSLSPAAAANLAAERSRGELLVFLDPALRPLGADWLAELVREALRPETGAVGPRLRGWGGRILHGGAILGGPATVQDAHRGYTVWGTGHFGRARIRGNFSAVSSRCLAIRRDIFIRAGGFDEEQLPRHLFAEDLCLRLRQLGYRVIWTPFAELRARAARSRRRDAGWRREAQRLQERWPQLLGEDPCYSPNLDLDPRRQFRPAFPPRVDRPWQDRRASRSAAPRSDRQPL